MTGDPPVRAGSQALRGIVMRLAGSLGAIASARVPLGQVIRWILLNTSPTQPCTAGWRCLWCFKD